MEESSLLSPPPIPIPAPVLPPVPRREEETGVEAATSVPLPKPPAFLFGSGLSSLNRVKIAPKEVKEPKEFISFDFSYENRNNIVERIRYFDQCRLYTPTLSERSRVNIPSSIERVNITVLKHLLALCGGCAGVRFSTEVLSRDIYSNCLSLLNRKYLHLLIYLFS